MVLGVSNQLTVYTAWRLLHFLRHVRELTFEEIAIAHYSRNAEVGSMGINPTLWGAVTSHGRPTGPQQSSAIVNARSVTNGYSMESADQIQLFGQFKRNLTAIATQGQASPTVGLFRFSQVQHHLNSRAPGEVDELADFVARGHRHAIGSGGSRLEVSVRASHLRSVVDRVVGVSEQELNGVPPCNIPTDCELFQEMETRVQSLDGAIRETRILLRTTTKPPRLGGCASQLPSSIPPEQRSEIKHTIRGFESGSEEELSFCHTFQNRVSGEEFCLHLTIRRGKLDSKGCVSVAVTGARLTVE